MKRKKTNPRVLGLIKSLYDKSAESKAALWKNLAKRFEAPNPNWTKINLSRLGRVTRKGETVVVPGKVLGSGSIAHPVKVYSFNASKAAADKIVEAGGSCGKIEDFLSKGSTKDVRIIK